MSTNSIAGALVKTTGVCLSTSKLSESITDDQRTLEQRYRGHADRAHHHRFMASQIETHLATMHQVFPSDLPRITHADHDKAFNRHVEHAPEHETDKSAHALSSVAHKAMIDAHKAHLAAAAHHESESDKHRHAFFKSFRK